MLFRLFVLFTVIPVIELYLLIKVGSLIGALPTVVLLLSISLVGGWLVRAQGFSVLRRIQSELAQGRLPVIHLDRNGGAAAIAEVEDRVVVEAVCYLLLQFVVVE